ncbi:MarR family transcriptional regulator [Leptolyngbyaceae cyanobacterium CCMR0082]|uniref:MarR family transcriptional regulator n=2 Tax=Adonisia turfae TaxID=2950184 RepID=A0A6M0SD95_9CYAN|nr:MarR family winged helix-turn-helix transcriptional regulator [Adonisia turfae]MDV3350191.1 MarR family winged helix-turn-helix transcriptional regulator [Leptothoe sp. LEGE 181152]NEZ57853.1 MarR family transcriptional regulator [Adonisia turfae CCMR0081]NEZ66469.1 MarR family transcriptional regulator [Adonisia turfae CCMR0082]
MIESTLNSLEVEAAFEVRDTCLSKHLRQADRIIMQLYDEMLRPHRLKSTQFTLLIAIRLQQPVNQKTLAECTVTDRTTLTRNLASLARQGLIQVQPGTDRRVKEISLTTDGHQRLKEAFPAWKKAQSQTEELLGKTNVHQLLAELSKISIKFAAT